MGIAVFALGIVSLLVAWLQVAAALGVAVWCTMRKVAVAAGWVLFGASLADAVLAVVRYASSSFLWQFFSYETVELVGFALAGAQLVAVGFFLVGLALLRSPEVA